MEKTLIHGLSEKDMQAVVNTFNTNDFYFPTLFPMQFNPTLSWKTLIGDEGIPVAADVIAFDASNPLKKREKVGKAQGDIPKISMQFDWKESEINTYNELKHWASQGNSSANNRLLELIYGDMEKCFKGCNSRLEWLALQGVSTGGFKLTNANNNGIVTEYDVDFLVPAAQKKYIDTANRRWTVANAATATPVTDIKAWAKEMKQKGIVIQNIFMSFDHFHDTFVHIDEVKSRSASFAVQVLNLERAPSLEAVNSMLRQEGLPTIILINSMVTIEKADGTRSVVNPWKEGNIVLAPSRVLGNTQYGPSAYETNKPAQMMQVKREHVLIQKWSNPSPLVESTAGITNAIPVFGQAQRSMIVNTTAGSFAG